LDLSRAGGGVDALETAETLIELPGAADPQVHFPEAVTRSVIAVAPLRNSYREGRCDDKIRRHHPAIQDNVLRTRLLKPGTRSGEAGRLKKRRSRVSGRRRRGWQDGNINVIQAALRVSF
jgi:hypothetical protein